MYENIQYTRITYMMKFIEASLKSKKYVTMIKFSITALKLIHVINILLVDLLDYD